jgi:hypothetical protein
MLLCLLLILGKVQFIQSYLLLPTTRRIAHSSYSLTRPPRSNAYSSSSSHRYSKKDDEDDQTNFIDGDVMIRDSIAISVAYELIGLIDTLNDSSFWILGGFAQPIPLVPLTLANFVQRTALTSICWIFSNAFMSNPINLGTAWKVILIFLLLQFGLSFVVDQGIVGWNFDPLLELRNCYVTLSLIFGWRYLFQKYL